MTTKTKQYNRVPQEDA